MRYRARVIPLYEGHRQEEKAFWEYREGDSIADAHRLLMRAYPYPKYFVEEPVADPRKNPGAEGNSHRAMRLELVKLNTDLEGQAPELESMFREGLEEAITLAKECYLYEAIQTYTEAISVGDLLHKRVELKGTPLVLRQTAIENLAVKAIVESMIEKCGCNLISEKEEE